MLNRWQAVLSVVCLSLSSVAATVEGSTLEGRVCGRNGQPIKGAEVRLVNLSRRVEATLIRTDERGQYRFSNVAPGIYKVSVSSTNMAHGLIADVKVDGNKRVDLPVNSAAPAKGKHLVWVPPRTGTHIGGGWQEVADKETSASALPGALNVNLGSVGPASPGLAGRGAVSSVVGGTQGAFTAIHIGVNPHPPLP